MKKLFLLVVALAAMSVQTSALASSSLDSVWGVLTIQDQEPEMLQPGTVAPDFTLNDIDGNPLSLSSLRGKYVVVDFWGSWCIWCVRGIPKMKEYYEKYKDKMEILGVDCRETVEKWKEGVKANELPWKHVYNPSKTEGDIAPLYHVPGYPTKALVDPEGKIVKVIVGEDPAFYELLDEVLK
ncbi:MAG: TlpA family protein disulfide reductase [Bacteroidaceae bacterium]|nr:TlpA family protein disulfide reductase [Bacteroidaceae bacterium]MCF0185131.1 TlpA family protein disulfide reductase [Bacteroidaceae bacterium]